MPSVKFLTEIFTLIIQQEMFDLIGGPSACRVTAGPVPGHTGMLVCAGLSLSSPFPTNAGFLVFAFFFFFKLEKGH